MTINLLWNNAYNPCIYLLYANSINTGSEYKQNLTNYQANTWNIPNYKPTFKKKNIKYELLEKNGCS